MRKFLFCVISVALSLIAIALVYNPSRYISACYEGLCLWAVTVLPSLLPFFFITLTLTALGVADRLFAPFSPLVKFLYKAPPCSAFVQLTSFISGYPVGAKLISELYKNKIINNKQASKISTFTSTSGPMFIIGSVGVGMFCSKKAGVLLIVSHLLSAIFNGIIFRNMCDNQPIRPLLRKNKEENNILYTSAYNATISCLTIGTFISVFYVFCKILTDFKILSPLVFLLSLLLKDKQKATAFCAGLIECTNGCFLLAKTQGFLTLPLTSFLISFGGLCIIAQSVAFLKQAKVNPLFFVGAKVLQGGISFLITIILQLVIPL